MLRKTILAALLILVTLSPQLQLLLYTNEVSSVETASFVMAGSLFSEYVDIIPKANAAGASGTSTPGDMFQEFFAMALQALVILNWVALTTVQALLDPDMIFGVVDPDLPPGSDRPMEAILRSLWVTSRNIVNGIFAFILLGAGIMLIVKSDSDMIGKIKSGFPKFVLAVVLVNFSWFFPRVILDMASVLTSVIFELPALVDTRTPCKTGPGEDCIYIWKVHFFPPTESECIKSQNNHDANASIPLLDGCPLPTPDGFLPNWGKYLGVVSLYYDDWNATRRNGHVTADPSDPSHEAIGPIVRVSGADLVVNGLAVNFAKLPSLNEIDFARLRDTKDTTTNIFAISRGMARYLMHLIFHVLIALAVGLALLALAAVLVVRIAVLWLTIAFMPFAFIGMAMGKGLGEIHEKMPVNIWKEFLKYAFYPALVAIPFAVGFTLMSNLYIYKALPSSTALRGLYFIPGVDTFHEFLWMLITIGIIWKGVFMILDGDKIAGGMVNTIKGIGEGSMKIAGKTLGYAPIMPLPGGSILGARDAMRSIPSAMKEVSFRKHQEFMGKSGGLSPAGDAPPHTKEAIDNLKGDPAEFNKLIDALKATRADNAPQQLQEAIQALVNGGKINRSQAEEILLNPKAVKQIAGESAGKLDDGAADSAVGHLRSSIESMNKVSIGREPLDRKEIHIALKAAESLKSRVPLEQVRKSLQDHMSFQSSKGGKDAVQAILDKLDAIDTRVKAGEKPEDISTTL
jgi:hypothetical protein